ncbi:hypothetical protein PENTCL1PPCAC_28339, partial [Pristionchus entomophagus]
DLLGVLYSPFSPLNPLSRVSESSVVSSISPCFSSGDCVSREMATEGKEDEKNVVPQPIDSSPSEEESSHNSESVHEEARPAEGEDESTALMESSEERMTNSPHCSTHSHEKKKPNLKAPLVMIVLTFLFFVIELTFGFINRSIALLADSYHMLSDVFALTVAMICLWIANRPSKYSTFGWVRAEVFGALINGVWLLTMCYTIALESIGRIIHSQPIQHPGQVLIVGTIGLVINLIGIWVFHRAGMGHSHGGGGDGHGHSHGGHGHSHGGGHGHSHDGHGHSHDHHDGDSDDEEEETRGARALSQASQLCHSNIALRFVNLDPEMKETVTVEEEPEIKDKKNLNMHGAFLHIITDAIGSIIVMVTAAIALFWPNLFGGLFANYLDPVLSLCLVVIISITAVRLVRQTSEVILRLRPAFFEQDKLIQAITTVQGVVRVNNVHCWTLVANRHLSTAEIEFDSARDFSNAAPRIRKVFHRHGIHSLTIQPTFKCDLAEVAE